MSSIVVDQLRKTYRSGIVSRKSFEALRGVSFDVKQGEIFGLLGPNGAGKTTLIKCLLGIVKRTSGNASLLGFAPGDRRGRKRVGYLPENHRIPRHHTANTALEYYGGLSGLSTAVIRQRRPALLSLVGLADWGNKSVREFSKGMQQRLGLAQAILHEPDVLILDEPTDGVDPVGRSEMRGLLRKLSAQGKTIFLNSHLLQEIELVCDRVVILNRGQVVRAGSVEEMTQSPQSELMLTLLGDQPTIRAALAPLPLMRFVAHGTAWNVGVRAANQAEIDRAIDALRRAGVSISEMSYRRQTLEETFLNLMQEQAAPAELID